MDFTDYIAEQFDDIRILRYQVPAFETLSLDEKLLVYYLSEAALAGRDILWDQNNKYNLLIRNTLEQIIKKYPGDREAGEYREFLLYTKKVFFANGIHHHYSMDKFIPSFSKDYFRSLLCAVGLPDRFTELEKIMFDPQYMAKRVVLDEGKDLIITSANNYYSGVTQHEVEEFYRTPEKNDPAPVTRGLNSTLVKQNGHVVELTWKIDGKYGEQIANIVANLEKALKYARNPQQTKTIHLLIDYYRTGDLSLFDTYSIEWLKEQEAGIDFINGFIEVYGDPLAIKASWESVVQIVDKQAGERTRILARNASWFEQHAPVDERFKKEKVSGVTARVMQVAMLGGDCHPATPIGINLPNAEWIRESYGSKSVTLDNITYAYHMASKTSGVLDEFAGTGHEKELTQKYGYLGSNLHTDLHECLGHGSGRMLPGVTTDVLKNYYSTIEEARADLFALYYIMDPKMIELGILPSLDVAKAEYYAYIRNGLMVQLTRIKLGDNIEESHMRNRQMIASWTYEQGQRTNVINRVVKEEKTFFIINDFDALRAIFGRLLAEIQRIKSEGDYAAARMLVETYGVKVDTPLHAEVLERYRKLNVPPYAGFINPEYHLIKKDGHIVDVTVSYTRDFLTQMLQYGENNIKLQH